MPALADSFQVKARALSTRRAPADGGRLVGSLLAVLRIWRRRARSRAELAGMDERMLRDIGLSHGEAAFEVSKPFWRR
jgi:uncharacterized protein YjiS (DUF1127 family)